MKRGIVILWAMLLLALCACAKQSDALPPTRAKEPVRAVEKAPEDAAMRELLQTRLEHASLCTCLMEENARRRLMQLGLMEAAEEDAPFLAAIAAFQEEMTERPQAFAAVAEDTLWLIDRTKDGSYVLEFLQAGEDDTSALRRSLVFDGEETLLQMEPERLENNFWASCAEAATDAERERVKNHLAQVLAEDASFRRVSLVHEDKLAETCLQFGEAQGRIFYSFAVGSGKLILNAEDFPAEPPLDALQKAILQMRFDESVVTDVDELLLRGFLAESLWTDEIPWDAPVPVRNEPSRFYEVRARENSLYKELCADDALREEFLAAGNWTLYADGGTLYRLTAQGADGVLTAHLYQTGVDVDGRKTPTRQKLETLAKEAENSDKIPAETQAAFVLAVMQDSHYGYMMAGNGGEVQWSWREADGVMQLVADVDGESGSIRIVAWFVTDASGNPCLSAYEERVEADSAP